MAHDRAARGMDAWVELAREVILKGRVHDLKCPMCGNLTIQTEWIPFADTSGQDGEYWLHCTTCGAENFVLKRWSLSNGDDGRNEASQPDRRRRT